MKRCKNKISQYMTKSKLVQINHAGFQIFPTNQSVILSPNFTTACLSSPLIRPFVINILESLRRV